MLKRDPNGKFICREEDVLQDKKLLGVVYGKEPIGRNKFWRFNTGNLSTQGELNDETYNDLLVKQRSIPMLVMTNPSNNEHWWMFKDEFYLADKNYTADEVYILILHRHRFIGQDAIMADLQPRIDAARKRGRALEHLLLCGDEGMGKATLAQYAAYIMRVNIRITRGDAIGRAGDMAAILTNLKTGDILLIENIELLRRELVEVLFPILEDYGIDIVIGKGASARSIRLKLPPFTVIGTTSIPLKVDKRLFRQFVAVYEFSPYKASEIATIASRFCIEELNLHHVEDAALDLLASQCNGRASDTIALIKKIFTYGDITTAEGLTLSVAQNGLAKYGRSQSPVHPTDTQSRERIPEGVRIEVWRRDGGKCARCGSREKLEYDHIVPVSRGGSNTARNIELLCESCNRKKSNHIE